MTSDTRRIRLEIEGRVQGVGFRPFIYRLARECGLAGLVGNDARGVFIELEGSPSALSDFRSRLDRELPPLAAISRVNETTLLPTGAAGFVIEASEAVGERRAEVSPDVATCADCLSEIFDPADRRYRYPFTNCTNCGPRYSIINAIPYDRPLTTMAVFAMCPDCAREYHDPADRRFHAQPNACPVCGPKLTFTDARGNNVGGDPIRSCAEMLKDGQIVAIKGIGGFHLTCRADDEGIVARLRERKGRETKPLAVMVRDLETAGQLARIGESARAALTHWSRPIVLLPRLDSASIADAVAPQTMRLGLMLPYTPLHHLLFAEDLGPLVMTSANPSDEPLCADNGEAFKRLTGIADYFLLHNRAIARPLDDSVVLAENGHISPLRRARGFVPTPLRLPFTTAKSILAVGGEMKGAVCYLSGNSAVLGEHLGELSNGAAYRNYLAASGRLGALLDIRPEIIACDLHPDYATHRHAHAGSLPVIDVQHHHAHIISCCTENGVDEPVIGIACDGTGYGYDGAIWGCEILVGDDRRVERSAHLRYFPLSGGDNAARQTWRAALGTARETFGADWRSRAGSFFSALDDEALGIAERRIVAGRVPNTSSLGRLFDAVAFLLGICVENRYEAEAAILLEQAAERTREGYPLTCEIKSGTTQAPQIIDFAPLIRGVLDGIAAHVPTEELARGFHDAMIRALIEVAASIRTASGLRYAALSGGCFANRILLRGLTDGLMERGFEVLTHSRVPAGDGGLALGQAVIAAKRSAGF